ncbi:hypothetical protein ACHAWX_006906 [Stephanocyclus meneghinianus]
MPVSETSQRVYVAFHRLMPFASKHLMIFIPSTMPITLTQVPVFLPLPLFIHHYHSPPPRNPRQNQPKNRSRLSQGSHPRKTRCG